MAVIYDQYYCEAESFNRTAGLDGYGNLTSPIPLVNSSGSFAFADLGYGDTLLTLTFKSSGSVKINLSNNVFYESRMLHGANSGTYSVLYGQSNGTATYLELYNSGTNTLAYSMPIIPPGPNESSEDITLPVTSAGTYDLKIKFAIGYAFTDMWSENDEEMLDISNVDEIYVEWSLYVRATDSSSGMESNYVEGYLYDETGTEMIGIGICLKENPSIEVSTDIDGYYKLGPIQGNLFNTGTLVVLGFIGYKTLEFPISGRRRIDIHLELEEDEPVVPEPTPTPTPSRPTVNSNKIVTVQDVVNFLLQDSDKEVFLEKAVDQGYPANRCVTARLIKTISDDNLLDVTLSMSLPDNKLVRYSYLSEQMFTIDFADFNEMFDFFNYQNGSVFQLASPYDYELYDGDSYPTSYLAYETSLKITGTRQQWKNLYNQIFDSDAEINSVTLINDSGEELRPSEEFYNALSRIVNGSWDSIQTVHISPLYTLTVEGWDDFMATYPEGDRKWVFALYDSDTLLNGSNYPTSNLFYCDGESTNTVTGYIWQWKNLIDRVNDDTDGEWEYLGLAIRGETWIGNKWNACDLETAINNIVDNKSDQIFKIYTNVSKSVSVSNHTGGWNSYSTLIDNSQVYRLWRSNTNKGVANSIDMIKITFSGYSEFTIYIRSYAETTWDYTVASNLNTILPTSSGSYPGGSGKTISQITGAKAWTYNNQQSGTTISSYTPVTYSGLDPNTQYFITVAYKKDGIGDYNDDRGYVLIPQPASPSYLQLTCQPPEGAGTFKGATGCVASSTFNGTTMNDWDIFKLNYNTLNVTRNATGHYELRLNSGPWLTTTTNPTIYLILRFGTKYYLYSFSLQSKVGSSTIYYLDDPSMWSNFQPFGITGTLTYSKEIYPYE